MKALLLRAAVLARRHRTLAESTRRVYRVRLERDRKRFGGDTLRSMIPA